MIRAASARTFTGPALVLLVLTALLPAPARGDGFDQNVRPLVEKYCLRCHSAEKSKGDVNLAKFADEESIRGDTDLWLRVIGRIGRADDAAASGERGRSQRGRSRARGETRLKAILDAVEGKTIRGPP